MMRNLAERITRFKPLQTLIYWVEFLIVTTILGAPLAIYEGYFRERQYGLATQTFGPWMGEQFEMLLVNMVIGRHRRDGALRRRSPRAAYLVDLGSRRLHVFLGIPGHDRTRSCVSHLQ